MFRKMNLMVALLATLLVMATNALCQTSGCNCANASLVGDTVGTRFNLGPGPINKVVGNPIEMPGAGPVLGTAGPSPRWNIDFGSNSIRIDFLQQPATYGMGSYFTFSSLDPQLAGCPPAFISGITVATNKPTTQFNVVAGATFGPHTVTVQIAPNGANLDWQPGEFILITLNFSCDPSACPGNLLRNGDFSAGINVVGNGSFPPSTVANWSQSAGSPQVSSTAGCNGTPGFVSMWGNQIAGEAMQQTLTTPIQAGHTYRLSACVRWLNNNPALPQYVRFKVRASNGAITYTDPATLIGIIGDPSNTPSVATPGITSTQWTNITLANWTAPATPSTYDTITINPENDNTANDPLTVSWGQIDNVCLQDLNDAYNNGDPHITTVDKVRYDFQSAGEFVALRDGGGLEIQTRQTPVAGACVSVNTAVAARVGNHRVTFEPNINGVPDPSGLQLRVDGALTTLGANGLALAGGGRVIPSLGGGINIDFPDGTSLIATPGWWSSHGKWYLNLSVLHTPASSGIMGAMAPGSWLPALPNGTSLGPRPSSSHQRFVDLYQTFADAWRVTNATSLFDYASGTSTATFTNRSWPQESGACVIPQQPPVKPMEPRVARQLCQQISEKNANADCVFDVTVTGEAGFAKTYLISQQIRVGSTRTTVIGDKDFSTGEPVTFTATVAGNVSGDRGAPTGTVQFTLDGEKVGAPVRLDSKGRATWKTRNLEYGDHRIKAVYSPSKNSVFLASSSLDRVLTVGMREIEIGPPKR